MVKKQCLNGKFNKNSRNLPARKQPEHGEDLQGPIQKPKDEKKLAARYFFE